MVHFILFCFAIVGVSFFAVPTFFGISEEYEGLTKVAEAEQAGEENITFEEMYAVARGDSSDRKSLNEITPAAGDNFEDETFSNGFRGVEDGALESAQPEVIETEAQEKN